MTSAVQPPAADRTDQVFSGVFLFLGIALIVLGMVAIVSSVFVTIGTVVLFGALLVAAGIAELIHVIRAWHGKNVLFNILSGIVYLIVGAMTIAHPIIGAISLTLIMSGFFFVAGVIRCFHALTHRQRPLWGWFLIGGIVDLVLGAMIASGWPVTGLWVIGLFVGIEMIMYGAAWITLASAMRAIESKA